MENIRAPFRGIEKDIRGRLSCYKQDWKAGIRSGFGYIVSPDETIFRMKEQKKK